MVVTVGIDNKKIETTTLRANVMKLEAAGGKSKAVGDRVLGGGQNYAGAQNQTEIGQAMHI